MAAVNDDSCHASQSYQLFFALHSKVSVDNIKQSEKDLRRDDAKYALICQG